VREPWSAEGRYVLYAAQDSTTGSDLWALSTTGEREPFPVAHSRFDEVQGQLSPDGRWVAYASDETQRYEIYVQNELLYGGDGGGSSHAYSLPTAYRESLLI
jgi:Tol biopolymer transport system component